MLDDLFIRWSMDDSGLSHEEHRFIGDWRGRIMMSPDEGHDIEVGTIHLQVINLLRVEFELGFGIGFHGLLDGLGGDEDNMFGNLIDGMAEEIRPDLLKTLYGPDHWHEFIQQLLHLERVAIYPKYRGQGIGLWAIRNAIARFEAGGECLVYAYPRPLQYLGKEARCDFPPRGDENADTVKLVRHYSKLGLVPFFPKKKTQRWPKKFDRKKHEVVMVGLTHRIVDEAVPGHRGLN